MDEQSLFERVTYELEMLSDPGELLDTASDRATQHYFSRRDLVLRGTEVGREYLGRQSDVESGGHAVVTTAGPPGAGKSTALKEAGYLDPRWRNIDSDIVKDMLLRKAIDSGLFRDLLDMRLADSDRVLPRELSSLVHRESVAITQNLMEISVRRGENVVIQGTLAWEEQPESLLDSLREANYENLTIFDLNVDRETSLARARARWWAARLTKAEGLGGRFVARRFIDDMFPDSGPSKCHANAQFMFEMANLASTRMVSVNVSRGSTEQIERQKYFGEEIEQPLEVDVHNSERE